MVNEAAKVNSLAVQIARLKSQPAQPGNIPGQEVKSKCPSCGVFHPSEECNAGLWWKVCPHCGWEHPGDTSVVDMKDRVVLYCRCLRCLRHWSERTEGEPEPKPDQGFVRTKWNWWKTCPHCGKIFKGTKAVVSIEMVPIKCTCDACGGSWGEIGATPEPTPEAPPWWKVCPHCGREPSETVHHWGEMGELLQVRCDGCHRVWEHPDAVLGSVPEPTPEPTPGKSPKWWVHCPHCKLDNVGNRSWHDENGAHLARCVWCGKDFVEP